MIDRCSGACPREPSRRSLSWRHYSIQVVDARDANLDNGRIWFYAAHRKNSEVIGMISVDAKAPECWWLNDLFVDPSYRRQGVASRLKAAVYNYASHQKEVKLLSSGVNPDNVASIGLNESLGWRHVFTYDTGLRLYSKEIARV